VDGATTDGQASVSGCSSCNLYFSKTPTPKPPNPARATPKVNSPYVPMSEGSLDQLQRGLDDLGKLGIGLPPPKKGRPPEFRG
jgi:hypothetical protein